MIRGFENNPLACEGIIGDGCGGGRWFFVQNETLFAFDELSNDSIMLLRDVKDAQKIEKKGCVITLTCKDGVINFDLSSDVMHLNEQVRLSGRD